MAKTNVLEIQQAIRDNANTIREVQVQVKNLCKCVNTLEAKINKVASRIGHIASTKVETGAVLDG